MTPILNVVDLHVHFGGVRAVDGLTFDVSPGIVQGIVGPNGSGKSTLLGAISALTPITSGTVSFDGKDLTGYRPEHVARAGLARTFQTVRLVPTLTVLENVMFGADAGISGIRMWRPWIDVRWSRMAERRTRVAALTALDKVGLAEAARRLPGELSYGSQRRVEIARAIVAEPKLVLLDEPTAGMNHDERSQIAELIRGLRADGVSQVLIDHDVDMIVAVADDLIALNRGRLLAKGHPVAVVREPEVQEAYLGRSRREIA